MIQKSYIGNVRLKQQKLHKAGNYNSNTIKTV